MPITTTCPVSGVQTKTVTRLNIDITAVHSLIECGLPTALELAQDFESLGDFELRLVFCSLAYNSGMLKQEQRAPLICNVDKMRLYLPLLCDLSQSYDWTKQPQFNSYRDNSNAFFSFLDNLAGKQTQSEFDYSELVAHDEALTYLGLNELQLQARLENTHVISHKLANTILNALELSQELKVFYSPIFTESLKSLKENPAIKLVDFNDLIEALENWDSSLNARFSILRFLRKKRDEVYSNQIDLSELDFLLNDDFFIINK